MIFDSLFQLMAEKKASDIFITAGAPIHIKIQGHTMPINQQVMEPPMIRRMIEEAIPPEKFAQLERDRELNLSFGRRDLGNFRVNVFWQRNSLATVVRYIQSDIPTVQELGMPPC
jgi:twitching motility protein PilU